MGKRILSMLLCCALLMTCISGLTLVSSAATSVKAADLTPSAYDSGQDAYWSGTYDGFSAFGWQKTGWFSWNGGKIANAIGISSNTVADLSISFDYYWDRGEDANNNWWAFNTTNADGSTKDGFGIFHTAYGMEGGKWAEVTVSRDDQLLGGDGKDDLFINVGDLANSKLYIRGVKVVATDDSGNTYTGLWGSYVRASIDFSSGTAVGVNASIDGTPKTSIAAIEDTGSSGMKMTTHNEGFNIKVSDIGLTGEDVAITVEYYMPSASVVNNTRYNMNFNGVNHTMRAQSTSGFVNGTDLTKDKLAICTYVVSGADAASFAGGITINTYMWEIGSIFYIKSITIAPASTLNTIKNPGYEYYDFTSSFAPNPYYPQYTQADMYGIICKPNTSEGAGTITENGLEMTSGFAYFTVTEAITNDTTVKPVGIRVIFAEGTTGTFNIDYQTKSGGGSGNDGWGHLNDIAIENDQAEIVLDDAYFRNSLNESSSFRLANLAGKVVERIEVYVLADKTALEDALDNVITDFTGKTNASKTAYEQLVADAQAVYDDAFATQAQVDAATTALTTATLKDLSVVDYGTTISHKEVAYMTGNCKDEGDNIGYTGAGDYLEFEVDVKTAGLYHISLSMATDNSASTVELRDGNNASYGSVVVPKGGWSNYNDYTLDVNLAAGQQVLRVYFAASSANFKSMKFTDGRYTLTNASWNPNWTDSTNAHYGQIVKKNGSYAFYLAHNKGIAIGDAANVLKDVTNVTIELTYWVESNDDYTGIVGTGGIENQANRRVIPAYTTLKEDSTYGSKDIGTYNMSTLQGGQWATKTWEVTDAAFADGSFWSDAMFYDEGCVAAEYKGGMYVSAFKAYATDDETKVISIVFTQLADMTDLQAAVDDEVTDLSIYTKATANAYTAALATAKAVLANEDATQEQVDAAKDALIAAKDALVETVNQKLYAEIDFSAGGIETVNGSITHNHPNEDYGSNGIFEVEADSGIYGIKMGKQNRGFGFSVANASTFLAAGDTVRVVISYYAPSTTVQDNSRLGFQVDENMYRVRVGQSTDQNFVVSGLTKDAVGTLVFELNAADSAKVLNNQGYNLFFWNYNDNADTGGDYLYVTSIRIEKTPDASALQAEVNTAITNLDEYTTATAADYTAALNAARAVLANAAASQNDINEALENLEAAKAALVALPSMLVAASENIEVEHNGYNSLEFADRWAFFKFLDRMGLDAGVYDLDVTFYYASTATHWWQIQLSNESGTRYSENNKYSADEGFQQDPDWLVNSNGEWTSGTVSFADAKLGADDAWKVALGAANGKNFDFGFHLCAGENPDIFIRGITFAVTDGDGVVHYATWGYAPTTDKSALLPIITAAKELVEGDYTPASWTVFAAALATAEAVYADNAATQDEIDAAAAALTAAQTALVVYGWDLVVESVTTTNGTVLDKDEAVKFVVVIKNVGNKAIPAEALYGATFKIDGELVAWSDNYKLTDKAPELKPGETITLTSCNGPENADGSWTPTELKNYTLTVEANDNPAEGEGIPNELDRTNNTKTITLICTDIDTTEIEAAIEAAKAILADEELYTTASWATFKAALDAAEKALEDLVDQASVDTAKTNLTTAQGNLVLKIVETWKLGDVNHSGGEVDTTDARKILQYAAGKITADELDTSLADVDKSGEINTTDARLVLQMAAGKITEYPDRSGT